MHESGSSARSREPEALIEAVARAQDRDAFAALFGTYAPRIKSLLMRQGASADAAEEFAQEAMLTVWRKAALFDSARASAAAWIFSIARHARIDRLRRETRGRDLAVHDFFELQREEPERPDEALDSAQRDTQIRSALKTLSQDQMRVVELSFFEGQAHGDIARLLGIPLGTVKSRLRLAMTRLRERIGGAP